MEAESGFHSRHMSRIITHNHSSSPLALELINDFPKTDILYVLFFPLTLPSDPPNSLTHGPPHGILDQNIRGHNAGCPTLACRVTILQPLLHVFGHIHEDHGAIIRQWSTTRHQSVSTGQASYSVKETVFVNAANAPAGARARDEDKQMVPFGGLGFQPVIVDLLE